MWVSNQRSDRLVANSVTGVGLRRASIEPPISVTLRGSGSRAAAISAVAASTGTAGWHTAITCRRSAPRCWTNARIKQT